MRTAAEKTVSSHFLKWSHTFCLLPIFHLMKVTDSTGGYRFTYTSKKKTVLSRINSSICQDQFLNLLCYAATRLSHYKQQMTQKDRNKQMGLLLMNNSIVFLFPSLKHRRNPSSVTDEVPNWPTTQNQSTVMKKW